MTVADCVWTDTVLEDMKEPAAGHPECEDADQSRRRSQTLGHHEAAAAMSCQQQFCSLTVAWHQPNPGHYASVCSGLPTVERARLACIWRQVVHTQRSYARTAQ